MTTQPTVKNSASATPAPQVPSNPVYAAVLNALQPLDEIGGVTGAAEYIDIMRAVARECEHRAETARANYYAEGGAFAADMEPLPEDAAAMQEVLDLLYDNGGAILYWQMPDHMRDTIDLMLHAGAIFSDAESDCVLHPDAEPVAPDDYRTGPQGFYIPHQFQR